MLSIYISHLWDTGHGRQRLRRLLDQRVPWDDLSLTREQARTVLDRGNDHYHQQTKDVVRQTGEIKERLAQTAEALELQQQIVDRGEEVEAVTRPILDEIRELTEAGAGESFLASLRVSMEKEVAALLEVDEDRVAPEMI